jgi:hypothetical protein
MKFILALKKCLTKMRTIIYDRFILISFAWIWLVSMLDHYLTIKLQQTIIQDEQNPIGRFLIELDSGSVALFMTIKMACLWVIAGIILSMYKDNKIRAYVCVIALSITQLLLLLYFFWGEGF